MPKKLSLYQQHRETIGNHTHWQDKRQGSQRDQNSHAQVLARQPGLHTGNVHRQNTAHAALQLLSLFSSVRNSTVRPAISSRRAEELSGEERIFYADNLQQERTEVAGSAAKLNRPPRYAVFPSKTTTQAPLLDDVEIVKMFDFSCMNNGENLSFAGILRQIGKTLQQPITMLALESKNIYSWNKGRGCASPDELSKITDITRHVDAITSQVISLLPGSRPLAVAQYIVGPLLERLAADLDGKPLSQEQELSLLQQVTQQARFSAATISHTEQMGLRTDPTSGQKRFSVDLPTFYLKNGVNHIKLEVSGEVRSARLSERNGKIFAMVSNGKSGEQRHQIYFNHLARKWEKTGNGKFNRFSKRERRLAHTLSLGAQYRYQQKTIDKTTVYSVLNPFSSKPPRLQAIEIYGRLVPYRNDLATGRQFIYDASQAKGPTYEVVFVQNEWHLKASLRKNLKFGYLYSPQQGKYLEVAMVKKENGKEVWAQINRETGFFWGPKFVRNEESKYRKSGKDGDSFDKKTAKEKMRYNNENDCYRIKRGIMLGKLCSQGTILNSNIDQAGSLRDDIPPMIAEGSIGAVYDTGDGYVLKKYKGKIDAKHKSRLQAANKNAKGFNRYYGPSSAAVRISHNADETASVSVRLRKIPGDPLSSIPTMTDKNLLIDIASNIEKYSLSENLANTLRDKGIIHNDINKGNILYSKENGFSIIDFDSAHFLPKGEVVSMPQTESMKKKFLNVFSDTLRDIDKRLQQLGS